MDVKKAVMVLLAVLVVAAFFLPWVNIDSPVAGGISKFISGKKNATMTSISGFQVPILANRSDSALMISVIQLFNPGVKDADKKSYLIWGVPFLAVLMAGLFWRYGGNKWLNIIFGAIGILIFAGAVFKLATTNMDKMVMKVSIAYGVWMLLAAYLCMGLLCGANALALGKGKKP